MILCLRRVLLCLPTLRSSDLELTMLGLDDVFDDILISSEEHVRKPGKEFFARALDRAGTTADRTVMVGNDEDNDILGARDRKSTRLNSSHVASSYAVFCLSRK